MGQIVVVRAERDDIFFDIISARTPVVNVMGVQDASQTVSVFANPKSAYQAGSVPFF